MSDTTHDDTLAMQALYALKEGLTRLLLVADELRRDNNELLAALNAERERVDRLESIVERGIALDTSTPDDDAPRVPPDRVAWETWLADARRALNKHKEPDDAGEDEP